MPNYTNEYAKSLINDRITRSKQFMRPFWDKFLEIYSLYTCYTKSYSLVSSGERTNVFIPYVFSKIETKLPRIIQATVGGEDWFKYIGIEERDDAIAEYHTKLAKFQFSNEIDTLWFFVNWWKETFMYGNSFAGVFYDKETKEIRKRSPRYVDDKSMNFYPQVIGYDFKPNKKTVYDGISLVPFDIFDCLPAPVGMKVNGLKRDAMDYFILRSEPSAEYLRSMTESDEVVKMHGFDKATIKKLLESKPRGSGNITDSNRSERMNYRGMTTIYNNDLKNPRYEMHTMWEDDHVVSIIDNEIIRNAGPDKYPFFEMRKPLLMAFDTPVPHDLFALGQVEPILRLNYYAQDLENAKLNSIFDIVYPGWMASIEAFGKDYLPILRRNMRGLHGVTGDPNRALAQMQKSDKSFIVTNEQVNIERLMNMSLGSGDILSGVEPARKEHATTIVAQLEQANFRFDLGIRLLKDFALKELLLMMSDRNQQYSPDEKLIRVFGEGGKIIREKLNPFQLIGNLDVIVKISPVQGNKFVYAQNLIKFLDILNTTQGRYPELIKTIGKALGLDNADDFIDDPGQKALQVIVQAGQEGLLKSPEQTSLVLKRVLDILAPPPQEKATPGPAVKDTAGLVRQSGAAIRKGG